MGSEMFNQLYEMIGMELEEGTDNKERMKLYHETCNGKPELIKLCQKLEEIIFCEQNFIYQ